MKTRYKIILAFLFPEFVAGYYIIRKLYQKYGKRITMIVYPIKSNILHVAQGKKPGVGF